MGPDDRKSRSVGLSVLTSTPCGLLGETRRTWVGLIGGVVGSVGPTPQCREESPAGLRPDVEVLGRKGLLGRAGEGRPRQGPLGRGPCPEWTHSHPDTWTL